MIPNDDTSLYNSRCASCHREDRTGSSIAPSLVDIGKRMTADDVAAIIRQGTGRMPAFPELGGRNITDIAEFVVTGKDKGRDPARLKDPNWLKYRNDGYDIFLDPDGYPAITPPWGTLNAIDLNAGHDPLEDSVRRISRSCREGPEEHRQRQLRRPGRHRQRPALHRRHQLRQEVPRLRQADRRAAVGNDAARGRQRDAVDLFDQWPRVHRDRVRRGQERRALWQ